MLVLYFWLCSFNIKLGLVVLLVLSPIIPVTFALDFGNAIPLMTLSRLLLLDFLFAFLVRVSVGKNRFANSQLLKPIVLVGVAFFLSNLLSNATTRRSWFEYFSYLTEDFLFFVVALSVGLTERHAKILLKGLVLAAILVSLIAVVEMVTGSNPFLVVAEAGKRADLIYNYSGQVRFGSGRLESVFRNPIQFGEYMALIVPYVGYFLWKAKSLGAQLMAVLSLAGCLFGIISAFSRSPIYEIMISGASLAILLGKQKKLILFGGVAAFAMILLLPSTVWQYLVLSIIDPSSLSYEISGSSMASLLLVTANHIALWLQHPFFGIGFATLPPDSEKYSWVLYGRGEQAYTYLLVETGILGLTTFLYFFWSSLRKLVDNFRAVQKGFVAEFSILTASAFVGYLFVSDLNGMWNLSFVLGLVAVALNLGNKRRAISSA
ncbi:MAG: O-antigen ligase family protein [Nitrososphaerota archaeon]|nr:O-antigen ligase family protein [Nitrososphaerota archaeon]